EEKQRLEEQMIERGEMTRLNADTFPDCVLYRSHPQDVARTEHLTFISTSSEETAGVNNNWMPVNDAHQLMNGLFNECMHGRTLYVIPYCLGPLNSPHARCGVEITDSTYVVLNMRIMTRMGLTALNRIAIDGKFTKGLHSTGDLDPARRYIVHYPEENLIESFGSGYGGNALLAKKCHALRIASWQALHEGWLAEHMLIMGVQNPAGQTHYIAAAFPSACGKTNLAMLTPPASMPGWKVFTIGDDIAWLYPGDDGRLWAMNPESGYFGVVPGTNRDTNKNAFDMIHSGTIFTNVGLTADNEPWWEGRKKNQPVKDWQGHDCVEGKPVAHPNSRFTVTSSNNPVQSPMANDPRGVPLSAIVFGGRRASLIPLVCEADDWQRGVVMGASLASETTAAATGQTGIVRRDPMAMKPFCGYNVVDYWRHWLSMGKKLSQPPRIFQVNWFRKDTAGNFLWPGFGENLRVIQWMLDRCEAKVDAVQTPIGYLPITQDINLQGLICDRERMKQLLEIDQQQWLDEIADLRAYFAEQGQTLAEFECVLDSMQSRLQ
ncbi:MAG TPA: phosphoenolpyruvate carboxykinase (GTP), partial [Steroidobacteraceae bacterium]|nr:phosphoenolpyruvate carboxykinase (GTP) [Steroidobacteraceae bacterium]